MVPLLGVALALAVGGPLTIGSLAPPLALGAFLKGEPVKALAKGTVYVVEFSGTACVPCVAAIPHLTAMQKKHPAVVIVSAYSEDDKDTRAFLAKQDDAIGYRVALHDEAVWAAWMAAANLNGIPTAFVVKDGRIAWIGSPLELAGPLQKILDGTFDLRLDGMQLLFKQTDVRAAQANHERAKQWNQASRKINELLGQRRWTEAIVAAEKAIKEVPEGTFNWRRSILSALASNPETVEKAIALAAELSAEKRWAWGDHRAPSDSPDTDLAWTLVTAHQENPDATILEAATLLVERAETYLAQSTKMGDELLRQKLHIGRVAVAVSAAKKDFADAARRQTAILALLRSAKFNPKGPQDREIWDRNQGVRVKSAEADLARYTKAAESTKK